MSVIWTREAIADLDDIAAYIARDDQSAAFRVIVTIFEYVNSQLGSYPEIGRPGRVRGTRELVIPRLPFIAGYRRVGRDVQVLAILHARRSWPEDL